MVTLPNSIASIEVDEGNVVRLNENVRHERVTAIADLMERNHFVYKAHPHGPYHLRLSVVDNRLCFDIHNLDGQHLGDIMLPLSPFRALVKEYFVICDAYYSALRGGQQPGQLEAVDMGRRGLHNEAATLLMERLSAQVDVDHDTARRLFTLMCVLHLRVIA